MLGASWDLNSPRLSTKLKLNGDIFSLLPPGGGGGGMVQTTKRCLRKILVKEIFNYEELLTVVREIEAFVNSRPLCYIYANDSMDDVITPSHMMLDDDY